MRRVVTTKEELDDLREIYYRKQANYTPMTDEQLDSLPEDPEYWQGLNQQRQAFRKSASSKVARPDWTADPEINAFRTGNLNAKFSCNCGNQFSPDGFHRCSCGQSWASFVISANANDGDLETRIVRPVNEHRERVLAQRTAARRTPGWVRAAVDGYGVPAYVRHNHGEDVAPAIKQDDSAPRPSDDSSNKDSKPSSDKPSSDPKPEHKNPFAGNDSKDSDSSKSGSDSAPKSSDSNSDSSTDSKSDSKKSDSDSNKSGSDSKSDDSNKDSDSDDKSDKSFPDYVDTDDKDSKERKESHRVLPVVPRVAAGGFGTPTQPGFAPNTKQIPDTKPASDPVNAVPEEVQPTPPKRPFNTNPLGKGIYTTYPKVVQPKMPSVAKRVEGNQYIEKRGDQWVILQKGTGKVLSHHDSEEKANESFAAMEMNKHGGKTMAFNENEYREGWALASSDSPLPERKLTSSFLQGYAEAIQSTILKKGEQAPGYDTVAPAFDGQTNGVADVLDTKKTIEDPTQSLRDDLASKLDSDNAQGQNQSHDTMADLSGWKTSALLEELTCHATQS